MTKNEIVEKLKNYTGYNPYILMIKRNLFVKGDVSSLNDLAVEFIKRNIDITPRQINKTVKVSDWYGLKLQEKWNTDFIPTKLLIVSYLGDTKTAYLCYVKYRQSVEPVMTFLSKKGIITNFLVEDYKNLEVDFDRYDRLSMSKDINRRLKEHQKDGIKFLLSRKKCILADDMGLAKTAQLSVASIEGNFDSVLIICPASIKTNWKKELMWYVPERDITIIDGFNDKTKPELEKFLGYAEGKSNKTISQLKKEAKEKGKWSENRYIIVNYDILDEFYEIPTTRSKENIEQAFLNSPMLQFIANKKSLIIVDESHRLSNMSSKQYKIIKDLINRGKPDSIYLATGTPITNNPQNYFNLLNLLDDPITDDWKYYMQRYCGAISVPRDGVEREKRNKITSDFVHEHGKYSWYDLTDEEKEALNEIVEKNVKMITIAKEATNLDELKERTSHLYLRRVKEDLTDITVKKNIHELSYDFDAMQIMEYEKLWEDYENAQLEADPTKEINKELLEGAIYRKYCSNQMITNTTKLADEFIKQGEKVVIICCYDEELYSLRDYYGDKCVVYNGKMSLKEKDRAIELFRDTTEKQVFIANIIAAGVGINLTCSRIMIYNDFDYVPSNCRQCEDRIYRIGQTRDVDIYYQFFRKTQYEKMWNTVMRKELVINQIIKKESEK